MTSDDSLQHPVLGRLVRDATIGWYESEDVAIDFLGGHRCRFVLGDYAGDPDAAELDDALRALLAAGPELLESARPYVDQYRRDMERLHGGGPSSVAPAELWTLVSFGDMIQVSRRARGDVEDGIYFSLECTCAWEIEHGLQLVVRNGTTISKIGHFDGNDTNADAYDDPSLVGVVYLDVVAGLRAAARLQQKLDARLTR